MRFAIPLWVPDLLIKADVKTAKVSVSLGAWSGMPIIAIGPKGGKIVGYGVGGKKIYANSSQATTLATHLKLKHDQNLAKQVALVLDWLKALGISAQEAGGHDIAVSHAVGEMLTQHFHVEPIQNLTTLTVFRLDALLPHRGKPFHPPADEHTGWAAAVASGDDEATVFPDLSTLQEVSAGSFAGSHGNKLFKTPTGKKWVFKSENPTIARAEEASARIQRLILGERVPAVKFVEVNGKAGALIQVISGTPLNENHSASASLSQMQKYTKQIAESFVADWLTANHDGHSGNFLADGSTLNAIDKGQSWRFFGKDKLEPGYHPNPSPTVYNKFWSAFEDGLLDPEQVLAGLSEAVSAAEKITLDQFKLIAAPYVATAAPFGGFDAGQRLNEMASRLAMLRKDIESFASGVFKKPVKLAQDPGADNFETMPEAESKDAKAPKLVIQNPDQPPVIEGGAKQPVVTTATPGWPVTKGDTTIHSPGTPPPAGVKWPGGVPGPGFVLATKYKGKDYQLAIKDGSNGLGPLFEVTYPDGTQFTFDSLNKAGDSLYLVANSLPLNMSATEKKKKKISLGSKAFKLGAFKAELAAAHSAPESTAAMAPAELEASGVVAKGAETLSPWQALASTTSGTVLMDHSVLPATVQASAKVAAKAEKQYVGGFAPGSVIWGVVTKGPLAGQKSFLVAQGASHYEVFSESGSSSVWSAKHAHEYFDLGGVHEPVHTPKPILSGPPPKAVLPAEGVKAKGALNATGGPLAAGTVIEKTIFIGPEASEGTHKLVVKDDGTFEVSHSFSDPTDGHPVVQTFEHKTLAHAAAFSHHVQVHGDWPDEFTPAYKKLLASIDGWKYWGIKPVAETLAQPQESPAYKVTSSQALLDDFKPGAKIVFTLGDGMIYTATRVSATGDYIGEWKWHTDLNPTLDTELPADKLFDLLSEPKAKIVELKKDAESMLDLLNAGPEDASPDNFETMPESPKAPSAVPWSVNENGGYPLWLDMQPGAQQHFAAEDLSPENPGLTAFLTQAPTDAAILAGDGAVYHKGASGGWHASEGENHLNTKWLAKQIGLTSSKGWSAWKPTQEALLPDPAAWAGGKVSTGLTALTMPPGPNFLAEAPPGAAVKAHKATATILAKKELEGFWTIIHPESEKGQKNNAALSDILGSGITDVWVQAPLSGSAAAPQSDAEKFTADLVSQGWTAHADSYPTAALGSYPVGTQIQVYSSGHIIAHLKLGDDLTYTVNGQDLGDAAKAFQYLKGLADGVAEQGKKLQVFTKIPWETSPDNWKTMPEFTVDLGIKATAVLGGAEAGTVVMFPPTASGDLPAVWRKDPHGDWENVQTASGKPTKVNIVSMETMVGWTNNYHDNGLELGVIFPPGSAKAQQQQEAQKPKTAPPAPKTKQPSVLKGVKFVYVKDISSYAQAAKAGDALSKLQAWKNKHLSLVQKPSNWASWVPPPGVLIEGKHEGQTYYLVTTTTGANQGTYEPGEKVSFAIIAPDGSLYQGMSTESSMQALKSAGKAAGLPSTMAALKDIFGLEGVTFAAGESHWSLHGLEELPIAPNMLGDVEGATPVAETPPGVTWDWIATKPTAYLQSMLEALPVDSGLEGKDGNGPTKWAKTALGWNVEFVLSSGSPMNLKGLSVEETAKYLQIDFGNSGVAPKLVSAAGVTAAPGTKNVPLLGALKAHPTLGAHLTLKPVKGKPDLTNICLNKGAVPNPAAALKALALELGFTSGLINKNGAPKTNAWGGAYMTLPTVLLDQEVTVSTTGLVTTTAPAPKPKPKPPVYKPDPVLEAKKKKAAEVADWAKDRPPVSDAEALIVLAHFQKHTKDAHPKMGLWVRLTPDGKGVLVGSDHGSFAGMMQALGLASTPVETPLGTFYETTIDALANATPGQPAVGNTTGPDGKVYPKGTTFTEKKTPHTVLDSLKSQPGFYKTSEHKSDPTKVVLKVKGTGEEQKDTLKKIVATLGLAAEPKEPVVGGSNVLTFVAKADLEKVLWEDTEVSPSIPEQPPAFVAKALPSAGDAGAARDGKPGENNRADLGALSTIRLGRTGHYIRMGKANFFKDGQILVRRVKDPAGKMFYEVTGTPNDPFSPSKSALVAKGVGLASCTSGYVHKFSEVEDASVETGGAIYSSVAAYVGKTGGGTDIAMFHNGSPTLQGSFKIRVPVELDIEAELGSAFQKMGYDPNEALAEMSAEDEQMFIQAGVIWSKKNASAHNVAGSDWRKPAWLAAQVKALNAENDVALAKIQTVFSGKQAVITDDADAPSNSGVLFCLQTQNSLEGAYLNVLQGEGWKSRKLRVLGGLNNAGASSSADWDGGAAKGAYTRMAKAGMSSSSWGNIGDRVVVVFHPRVYQRSDWWGHSGDAVGNIRTSVESKQGYFSGNSTTNEALFFDGLSVRDAAGIVTKTESDRTSIIAKLKAGGLEHVNGIPLEQYVVNASDNYHNRSWIAKNVHGLKAGVLP